MCVHRTISHRFLLFKCFRWIFVHHDRGKHWSLPLVLWLWLCRGWELLIGQIKHLSSVNCGVIQRIFSQSIKNPLVIRIPHGPLLHLSNWQELSFNHNFSSLSVDLRRTLNELVKIIIGIAFGYLEWLDLSSLRIPTLFDFGLADETRFFTALVSILVFVSLVPRKKPWVVVILGVV